MSDTGAVIKAFLIERCPDCNGRGGPGVSAYPPCDRCAGIGQTYTDAPEHRILGPDDLAALRRVLEVSQTAKESVFVDQSDTVWFDCTPSEFETQIRHLTDADLDRLAALIGGES